MAGSQLQADMVEALWSCLEFSDIHKLQKVLENPNVTPNMFMPPKLKETSFSKYNKYTLLNWACYYRFHEGIALLMLKGGDAFRKSRQHFIKQREKIFPSAIETVFHQYSKTTDSREYAYILALINCTDNEVTEIGRNPDAYLYEDQYTQISPLDYALVFSYFGGIRWLIQNRHANIYLKNQNGYDPIAQSLKVFEDIYKTYHTFLESCGSVTDAHTNYKIAEFTHHFRRMVHVLYWIKSCTGGRLDLHKYH